MFYNVKMAVLELNMKAVKKYQKKNRTNDTNNIDIDSQQQMVQIRNH